MGVVTIEVGRWERGFRSHVDSLRAVRAWAETRLRGAGIPDTAEITAVLLLSELVSQTVQQVRVDTGEVTACVQVGPTVVRVEATCPTRYLTSRIDATSDVVQLRRTLLDAFAARHGSHEYADLTTRYADLNWRDIKN